MGDGFRKRRLIALIAAYVVALQALLLPLSVAAAGPFATSLCSSASLDGSQPSGSHQNGCPCAGGCGMHCCAHAFVPPPQVVVVVAEVYSNLAKPALAPEPISRPFERRPQIPRGPPAA